ncbi:TPA: hypothetical protein EYP37_05665 [Candidatus Poribacteria bacterium]|nr:hypothetical protein [Candidatus Poribacteria bacterium]
MQEVELERKVDRLELALERLAHEVEETSRSVRLLSMETRALENEMRSFKDEMNRRWGDLANRLGTLVEDIVAPAFPEVIRRRFNLELEDVMVRRKRRRGELREEFDLIGAGDDKVFVVEVKSRYKASDVDQFSEKLERFKLLFPEYEEKEIIGVVASLYLDEGVVRYATGKGYYAMGMKGDYMDILNFDEMRGR